MDVGFVEDAGFYVVAVAGFHNVHNQAFYRYRCFVVNLGDVAVYNLMPVDDNNSPAANGFQLYTVFYNYA